MDKQSLITSLKEKAGVENVSDRSFEEVAGLFAPQFDDDSKITDESWALPVQMLKTMSGQLRHDTSAGINDFKVKYEADHKAANAKAISDAVATAKAEWEKSHVAPVEAAPTEKVPDISKLVAEQVAEHMKGLTGEDSEFGKLSKQFSAFLKAQAEKDKAVAEASVRDQIKDFLIGRGVEEDDYALEITLEKLTIGENPDVSVLKAKAEKDYESIYKRMHKGDGAQPFANGGGIHRDSNTEFQNFIKAKQAEAAQEAKDAEELRKNMM